MARPNGSPEDLDISPRVVLRERPSDQTGATSTSLSPDVRFTIIERTSRESASGRAFAEPEALYSVGPAESKAPIEKEITLIKIRRTCAEAIEYLDQAFREADAVARETTLTFFNDTVFRLGHYLRFDINFGRSVTLLHTAVIQNLSSVYSEQQILGLRRCLRLIRENIYMSDIVLRECTSILSHEAGFDIAAPTAGAEYYDEDSEP